MNINDNITSIKGIGEKTALLFSKASVFCVNDLLHYFPRNYINIPDIVKILDLFEGSRVVIKAKCSDSPVFVPTKGGKNLFSFHVKDDYGSLRICYFGMPFLKKTFYPGRESIFFGVVKKFKNELCLSNPKILSLEEYENLRGTAQPVYPLIKSMTNATVRKAIKSLFDNGITINDYLDDITKEKYSLMDIQTALRLIHFPNKMEDVYEARRRLAFDEFFLFTVRIASLKKDKGKERNQFPMTDVQKADEFIDSLSFELTNGQKAAIESIKEDLASGFLMNRLLQGDVGCGKTIIAFYACMIAASNGFQSAIMAPTEVLARQHYEDIIRYQEEFGLAFLKPILLVGSLKQSEKKCIQNGIREGEFNLIIGTHAVIQEKVEYKNLALAVTDEQHRFGVKQRLKLMEAGRNVNVLVMSATPIPRTLGLILYGDLDVSLIKELPANRLPIKNALVGSSFRPKLYKFIYEHIKEGRQAYIICPMVEEGDMDNIENVIDYSEKLKGIFPKDVVIASLHGKMKQDEKDRIMDEFKTGKSHILVSTTVVEVGVNVPNATMILIENAERFGLASLHQLRGRVGRGGFQSYCMFLCSTDSKKSLDKLDILSKTNDGFKIAEEDLKQRGPGDFFGLKQSGMPDFQIADIYTDSEVLKSAKEASEIYLKNKNKNINNFMSEIDLSEILSLSDFHSVCL